MSTTNYHEFVSSGTGFDSIARVKTDGRISVKFDLKEGSADIPLDDHAESVTEFAIDSHCHACPKINVVIMIVGSRGDVQPFIALGKQLKHDGHRVRIATHETFRNFVDASGLDFFSIGGNPQDLMSYMVKNPGLIPGYESLINGDIGKKRRMLAEIMNGCWLSCHSPCPSTGHTFVANAIISNPPAFAHVHCAEALGIPLMASFTMPWSPTTAFPHPLVHISTSNIGRRLSNYLTYAISETLQWQGIGDIINHFRTSTLGIPALSSRNGAGILDKVKVPWTYCMSPALVPKPNDWKNHIDVVGFYFLDLASNYTPQADLVAFLDAGEPPIYVGFGSVVVDNPAALTQIVFNATQEAGVRVLVSAGWGGLGGTEVPPHVFMLGNIPHDWLFDNNRVSAVVHHGGAGTTAIGLSKGLPTVVVPFFGDQGFWGDMIHKAGAGPEPIPHKELTKKKLREAIKYAISPKAKEAARSLGDKIHSENGLARGVDSFYKHLPLLNMRCELDSSRLAVWWCKHNLIKLSAFAAHVLSEAKLIDIQSLNLHRPKEYDSTGSATRCPTVSGCATTAFWNLTHTLRLDNFSHKRRGSSDSSKSASDEDKTSPKSPQGHSVAKTKSPTQEIKETVDINNNTWRKRYLNYVTMPFKKHKGSIIESAESLQQRMRKFRIQEGKEAVQGSTAEEREFILKRFEEIASEVRKKKEEEEKEENDQVVAKAVQESQPEELEVQESEKKERSEPSSLEEVGQNNERFTQDLGLAIRLSLKEGGSTPPSSAGVQDLDTI